MGRTLLIFPPGWNVYTPYLSVPLLTAVLRTQGHSVVARDLNVEFHDRVLSPGYMEQLRGRVEARDLTDDALATDERALVGTAQLAGPMLISSIEAAKRVTRSREGILDPESEAWASRILAHSLNFVSAAYPGLKLDFNTIELRGYKRTSTARVLAATHDSERNPFIDYYEADIAPWLAEHDFSLVGFSLTRHTQLIPTMTLARLIRQDCGDGVTLVLGGNFATRMVACWDSPHPFFDIIDLIVRSGGETALLQLVEAVLIGRRDWSDIPNVCFVREGRLVRTPISEVDIDTLPTPDFGDFPLGRYFSPDIILPLVSSRGCAHKCAFCAIPWASNSFRKRATESVVRDMRVLSERHATRYFTFVDETFVARQMDCLSDAILQAGLDVRWYAATRFSPHFTNSFVDKIQAAGCRILQFGLESYSQRVLNRMRKGTRLQDVRPTLLRLLDRGIGFHLFCFLGFPGETAAEAMDTLQFVGEMAELARHEYTNAHCSNGVGTFHLVRHAPVAREPDRWGVRIIRPPLDEDLTFDFRYEVDDGLSSEEVKELLSRHTGCDDIPNAFKAVGRVPVAHSLGFKQCWEEWNFLRACYREAGLRPRSTIPTPPQGTAADRGGVSGWAVWGRFRHGFLSIALAGPAWLAFDGRNGHVVELSRLEQSILEQIAENREKGARLAGGDLTTVEMSLQRLQRLGLLERAGDLCRVAGDDAYLNASSIPAQSLGARLVPTSQDGAYLLVDLDREEVHRLNASAALFWTLVDGRRTVAEIEASLAAWLGEPGAIVADFLRVLLSKDLIFLRYAPQASDASRESRQSRPEVAGVVAEVEA